MTDNAEQSAGPKAIASLAKKQSDVTRQGTQKLKFTPTLAGRRKKEEIKQESAQSPAPPSDKGDGKGRGRGRGRGGEGRGAAPRPSTVEMTASGPFAMGPALAGTSARRGAPRAPFMPVAPQGPTKTSASGANPTVPTSRKEKQRENILADTSQTPKVESDEEVYSEPDEGVEIIDMVNVRQMDWMAPEALQKDRRDRRKGKEVSKKDIEEVPLISTSSQQGPSAQRVDQSNALDLDTSEEEEDFEDLREDFALRTPMTEEGVRQERLYFFQFPEPFPTFVSVTTPDSSGGTDAGIPDLGSSTLKRKVSFAADVKSPAPSASGSTTQPGVEVPKQLLKVDGVIGHMEVYRSGIVKMRLGNGIVLNVSEGTQASFLQQAVHLDMESKKLHVLGKIGKKFVVSPDLDALLTSMELADIADKSATPLDDANLIKMDTA